MTPSEEWVRLQFSPINPYTNIAIKYTEHFETKYTVQRRQMRADHPDSKYAYIYYTYLKEFAVKFKNNTTLAYMDDKATVPIGEPLKAISMSVHGHNKLLGAVDGCIRAFDPDQKLSGLIPSVLQICDIPESTEHVFFSGVPFVTTKKKVFE